MYATRRGLVLALGLALLLPLAAGLGGCGKKADLKPPKGKERESTYPRPYPYGAPEPK